jgi:hypothetical protein
MFENRTLRKIFEPKWAEGTGGWGKLHNKEFHNLYSSPNVIRVVKSRDMRGAGLVAHAKDNKGGFWKGHWKERNHMGYLGIDLLSIVKWVLKKWSGRFGQYSPG